MPSSRLGWGTALTAESLLDQVLEDAYAHLEALEGRRGSLFDAPTLLSLRGARPSLATKPHSGARGEEGPVRLSLDLAGFSPDDVAVQLDGRRLKVTARRENQSRAPDGCCARDCREVSREVLLPEDADLEAVACALDTDGQLRVEAPRLPPPERVVPVLRLDKAVGEGGQTQTGGEEKEAEGAE